MRTIYLSSVPSVMLVILAAVAGFATASQAAPPSQAVPYSLSGRVDHVDYKRNTIVVHDQEFGLPVNVSVRSGTSTVSRSVLTKGMHIGFNEHKKMITEIWILSRR